MEPRFDVFLSYNTKDQESVKQLAEALRLRGISVWLDDWMIQPGTPLVRSIDKGIVGSSAIAVFIGANNFGPWQDPEVEVAIAEQIRRDIPVIPVLLPGTTDEVFEQLPRFLKRSRCVDFRSGLQSKKAMNYLLWGITGKNPELDEPPGKPAAPAPPPDQESDDDAIADLVQLLKTQNVTFFLGPGAAYGSNPMPAQASDIARYLLSELKIIETTYNQLLPPVDVAGLYYAIKSGDKVLESRVTNRMAQSSKVFPHTHARLAGLLKLLTQRPARRSGGRGPQLIVTTNLDLMMERALLRAGISFTRIVQHRSGQQIIINQYDKVRLVGSDLVQLPPESDDEEEPVQAGLNNFDELDLIIKTYGKRSLTLNQGVASGDPNTPPEVFNLNKMTQPILYKFLGSQDIGNSCVISTSHHFEFARSTLQHNCIPESLMSNIRNSTILFLGLWFMDPDFRLTYYTLLRDALHLENDRRYALQLPPQRYMTDIYRQMEAGLWEKIKEAGTRQMGITTIEEPCDIFLDRIYEKVQAEFKSDS